MIKKIAISAVTSCALLIGSGAFAASLAVANHSFEDDPAPVNTNSVGQNNLTPTAWTGFGSRYQFFPEHPDATFWNPQDVLSIPGQGLAVAGTQQGIGNGSGGSGLYQDLTTTYVEDWTYTFTLWVGGSYESPGGDQTIAFAGATTVDLSGALLASNTVTFPSSGNNWVQNSVQYTATASDAGNPIRIMMGTTTANGTQSFDVVEVDAVPEPSTTALFGLAGMGLFVRRRR